MIDFANFLTWEVSSRDTIDFKKVYVDMAGDLISGLLLSQIVYWYLPDKQGKTKLRVKREGHYWIAKKRTEWWDEIRITSRQYDRASKILADQGIIVVQTFKFNGSPTKHIRLDIVQFLSVFTQSVNSISPNGENHFTLYVKSLTESTTKTTTDPLGVTPPAGSFVSQYAETHLHKNFGHHLKHRKEGDHDFKDPRLYHPALRIYRGIFKFDVTPKGNWRDKIINVVGTHKGNLKIWRKSCDVWAGTSTNPNAPMRVLAIYENGGVLDDLHKFKENQKRESPDSQVTIPNPLSTQNLIKQMEGWQGLKDSGKLDN